MKGEKLRGKNPENQTFRRRTTLLLGGSAIALTLSMPLTAPTAELPNALAAPAKQQNSASWVQDRLYGTEIPPVYQKGLTRDTGVDSQACIDFDVCGTDLGQPFLLPNGSVGYLFGDTLSTPGPFIQNLPRGAENYRAQTMLESAQIPQDGEPIIFTSAGAPNKLGMAGELLGGKHMLLSDGVSLPNGDIVVSYQHTVDVPNGDHSWYTDYSGLAVSHNGGRSFQTMGPKWHNNATKANNDPYQMWSMQLDGDYVYITSIRSGRRPGDMMLFRVPWQQMSDESAYTYWDGGQWGSQADAKAIATGHFGEPSLRKISDSTWVLAYADYWGSPKLVTRTLKDNTTGPSGEWNNPVVQLTNRELPNLYGGGIHPYSTHDNLIMMISTWQTTGSAKDINKRQLVRYDVSHYITTVNK